MMLRLAATGSLVLGLGIVSLYLTEVGKTPWASPALRQLRQMKDRDRAPVTCAPMSIEAMSRLPRRAPLSVYAALERHGVTLEGYVQIMGRSADGDFHLDVAPRLTPDRDMVPFVTAEITPPWHETSATWHYERLYARFRPYRVCRAPWDDPPARVRLSGWLLYDFPYEGARPRPDYPPRLAQWEIHPVTRIEVWDDSRGRYVEFPR